MKLTLSKTAEIFAQLGNETRLKIIRHLVKAGDDGAAVGDILAALKIPASTLSHHLRYLRNAGLIKQYRHGTTLICVVDFSTIDAISAYLTDQCCVNNETADQAA